MRDVGRAMMLWCRKVMRRCILADAVITGSGVMLGAKDVGGAKEDGCVVVSL